MLEAKIKSIFQHAKQPYFRIMCYTMQSNKLPKRKIVLENFISYTEEVNSLLMTNTLYSVNEFLNSSFN
jgi:hypothetical protein